MFSRYGDQRNIPFVSPAGNGLDFKWPQRLQLSATIPLYTENGKILCSHTRYNRGPVHFIFPKDKSKYITILRHPISQFESAWGFYRLTEVLGLENDSNPIQTYLRNATAFAGKFFVKHPAMLHMGLENIVRNSMMFDLGFKSKYFENRNAVMQYVKYIEEEYDLVLINEYYDESLILLKNLLCWDFDDILYLKQRVRKTKSSLNYETKANILSWNHADLLLYHHFNKTLWRKISEAGPKFYEDLQIFREKQKIVGEACLQELEKGTIKDDRKQNYPNEYYLQMCAQMAFFYPRYLEYTRDRWNKIWKTVDDTSLGDSYIRGHKTAGMRAKNLKYKPVSIP